LAYCLCSKPLTALELSCAPCVVCVCVCPCACVHAAVRWQGEALLSLWLVLLTQSVATLLHIVQLVAGACMFSLYRHRWRADAVARIKCIVCRCFQLSPHIVTATSADFSVGGASKHPRTVHDTVTHGVVVGGAWLALLCCERRRIVV
jgi:hypothetical protein